ncbi:unnamed protein product [Cyclocybe aegerita]|uniref:Uncharacterized protein n=1 Tax=Cyclocybe aegerita TaxID=1973307 RepID=A0A8S0X0E2_CYCAE|nr:unnamed protein product [Cyclocybe aegerita]
MKRKPAKSSVFANSESSGPFADNLWSAEESSPAPPETEPIAPPKNTESALKQVIGTRDIMSNVFQHIASNLLSDSDEQMFTSRRSLFLAAQTCRAFVEPALDSLWAVIPSLVPLLSLLPSLKRVNDKLVLGCVAPKDWEQFDLHARRVRIILMKKPHPAVSPYVYLRIPHHKTTDLLPGLKEVRIAHLDDYRIDLSGLFTILTSNIRLVELNKNAVQDGEFLGTFLSSVVVKIRQLHEIILRGDAAIENEINSIIQLKDLKTVELLLPNVFLSTAFLQGLGNFEDLRNLTLDTGKRPAVSLFGPSASTNANYSSRRNVSGKGRRKESKYEEGLTPSSPSASRTVAQPLFVNLRQLHLVGNLESLARTMKYMKLNSLTSFNIEERQDGQSQWATSLWRHCFDVLSSTAAHSLKTIKITHSADTYSSHRLSASLIAPLLQIKNMESLEITTTTMSLDDAELQQILGAFTNLKLLILPARCHDSSPTLRPLFRPLEICPALQEVSLCVGDTHNYADVEIPRGDGHQALRKLRISSSFGSLTDTQVIRLARLFDRAFPNLEIIEGYGPQEYNESWKRVQEFRQAVQEIRRELE